MYIKKSNPDPRHIPLRWLSVAAWHHSGTLFPAGRPFSPHAKPHHDILCILDSSVADPYSFDTDLKPGYKVLLYGYGRDLDIDKILLVRI